MSERRKARFGARRITIIGATMTYEELSPFDKRQLDHARTRAAEARMKANEYWSLPSAEVSARWAEMALAKLEKKLGLKGS